MLILISYVKLVSGEIIRFELGIRCEFFSGIVTCIVQFNGDTQI